MELTKYSISISFGLPYYVVKKGYLLNNCVVKNGEETDRTRVIATGFHQVHVVTAKQFYTFTKENSGVQDKPLEVSAVFYPQRVSPPLKKTP
jgi:hypothetical protein